MRRRINKIKQKSHATEKLKMNERQQKQHHSTHNRRNRRNYTIFLRWKNGQFQKRVFALLPLLFLFCVANFTTTNGSNKNQWHEWHEDSTLHTHARLSCTLHWWVLLIERLLNNTSSDEHFFLQSSAFYMKIENFAILTHARTCMHTRTKNKSNIFDGKKIVIESF